jgi:hydroxymethylpyrimidine/phosphomethylpyrimidine kinase
MAGLATDLKTFQALSVYGMGVPTCLTAQSATCGGGIVPVDPQVFAAQLDAVYREVASDLAGVKLGLLPTPDHVSVIVDWVGALHSSIPVILDPIRWSGIGQPLNDEPTYRRMLDRLLPLCRYVAPNAAEATEMSRLLGLENVAGFSGLSQAFPEVFFIQKGLVDSTETVADQLWLAGEVVATTRLAQLEGYDCRGTGCTHSSAFTAALAQGFTPERALTFAQQYVWQCMEASVSVQGSDRRLLIHPAFTPEELPDSR